MCCINDPFASKPATGFQTFYSSTYYFVERTSNLTHLPHSFGFHLIATRMLFLFFADVYSSTSHNWKYHGKLHIIITEMSKKVPLNSYGLWRHLWAPGQSEGLLKGGGIVVVLQLLGGDWTVGTVGGGHEFKIAACEPTFTVVSVILCTFSISKMTLNFIVLRSQQFCFTKKCLQYFILYYW